MRIVDPATYAAMRDFGTQFVRAQPTLRAFTPALIPVHRTRPFALDAQARWLKTRQMAVYAVNRDLEHEAAADLLGFQFHARYRLHVVRARPANHTGPGQTTAFVCSDFARQMAAIELGLAPPELRVGNIDVRRDFCDVRDVVEAYALLLDKGCPGEAYNIGVGQAVALRESVEILASFCSRPVKITVDATRVRADDPKVLYVSNAKLVAETGWRPRYEIGATLRDLFDYWLDALGRTG